MPLLDIKGLVVVLDGHILLDDIHLQWCKGKLGLIGESGSGKSILVKAILRLLPQKWKIVADKLDFAGMDLRHLSKWQWQQVRGKRIGLIVQEAKSSLNPLMTIGKQLQEVASGQSVIGALSRVYFQEPEIVLELYPHQLSGGMAQRVMIAMMLLLKPQLLIADEIVSSLDTPLQAEILQLLQEKVDEENMSLLYISHDIDQASRFCDQIAVMKDGRLLAMKTPQDIALDPHPYIQRLFQAKKFLENPCLR